MQEIVLSDTNKIVVTGTIWKGQDRLDIRHYWKESNEFFPTKKGISMPKDEIAITDLIAGIVKSSGIKPLKIIKAIEAIS